MNKFVELAITKQKMIEGIDEQIHFEAIKMIKQTLDELQVEYEEMFDGAFLFQDSGVDYYLAHAKGDYFIKFMLNNMKQEINIMNNDSGDSKRIGTGLEQYSFKNKITNQLNKISRC